MLGLGAPKILEQLVGPDEVDTGALLDGAQPEGDGQMRLADARRAEEQDVGRLADEGQPGEVADLALVDRWLEAEIKLVERALKRQVGQPGASAKIPLAPDRGLGAQQIGQEVGVRQLLLGRRFQPPVEHRGGFGEPQLLKRLPGLGRGDHRPAPTSAS